MANYKDSVDTPLDDVTLPLVGEFLIDEIKVAMKNENVFLSLFGTDCKRVFVKELPSYNDTVLPLMEFYWASERPQSRNTRHTGQITARIVLPPSLQKDINVQRRITLAFQAFLNGKMYGITSKVPGLTMLGTNADYRYQRLLVKDGFSAPAIEITIPFEFDLRLLQLTNENFDYLGPLDGDPFGNIETYRLKVKTEEGTVIIQEDDLVITGQTN